ncbi:hypothetical protein AN219_11860 [Streptomyces nanshensis]|nr:hypothetical protein AN219_11860 [Streptomyces nanshensis]
MNGIDVRPVRTGELEAVAVLRWQWAQERQRTPVTSRDEFVRRFVTWALEHESSHRCLVVAREGTCGAEAGGDTDREDIREMACDEGTLLGMAWLAITRRVPHPGAPERASGDVQCVYVVPDERDGGLGARLMDGVLALARDLGLERVTVHSSDRAVTAYTRAGFAHSPLLLQAEVAREGQPGTRTAPVRP